MNTYTITVKSKSAVVGSLTATVEAESPFKAIDGALADWAKSKPWVWDYAWDVKKFDPATGALVLKPTLD